MKALQISQILQVKLLFVFSLLAAAMILSPQAQAQQFNSDNWWMSPEGTVTTVATRGENYSTLLGVWAAQPNLELTLGTTLYKRDKLTDTLDHYSTTAYAKYGFYENEAKTGGASVMGGTGVNPGYLTAGERTNDFKSYWVALPVTLPFMDNTISWDIMPGWMLNQEQGPLKEDASGFTWSTRVAVYKVIPQSAIVAEVFGAEGDVHSESQYKAGVRWESQYVVAALTYGGGLDGSEGAGFEFGIMILSPQFLCFDVCR